MSSPPPSPANYQGGLLKGGGCIVTSFTITTPPCLCRLREGVEHEAQGRHAPIDLRVMSLAAWHGGRLHDTPLRVGKRCELCTANTTTTTTGGTPRGGCKSSTAGRGKPPINRLIVGLHGGLWVKRVGGCTPPLILPRIPLSVTTHCGSPPSQSRVLKQGILLLGNAGTE